MTDAYVYAAANTQCTHEVYTPCTTCLHSAIAAQTCALGTGSPTVTFNGINVEHPGHRTDGFITVAYYAHINGIDPDELRRNGWRADEDLCRSHGTGFGPSCTNCRKVADR